MRTKTAILLLLVIALCSGSWAQPEETTLTVGLLWGSDAPELVVVSGQGEWRSELVPRSFSGSLHVGRDGGRLWVTGPDAETVLAGARIEVFPTAEIAALEMGGRFYPGSLVIELGAAQGLRVLNRITLEDYVLGTFPHQVFDTAPWEAMKTQAVVLRTRALYELGKRHSGDGFDLCPEAGCCWEYGWERPPPQRDIEAVRSTEGQILCYRGKPILACFDANAGGWTEDIDRAWPGNRPLDYPYLQRVPSPTDESGALATRDYAECWEWKDRAIPSHAIREHMAESYRTDIGQVTKLEIRSRTASGRVRELVVSGTESSRLVVGSDRVREILGTPSSLLDPDIHTIGLTDGTFRISGRGQGGGVGLSQHGALGMALAGAEYDAILGHYYPGVDLVEDLGRGSSRSLSPGPRDLDANRDDSLGGPIIRVGLFFGHDDPTTVSILGSGIWRAGQQDGVFDGEVLAEARGGQVMLVSAGTREAVGDSVELSPTCDDGWLQLKVADGEQGPSTFRGSLLLHAESGRLRVINRLGFEDSGS